MNFLDNYQIYSSNNEVPPLFHKWTALSVLASGVSRRVWVEQGIFQVYPNLYVILVADPGWKKSTAKDLGALMTGTLGDAIPQTAEAMTKQAMTQLLGHEKSPCKKKFEWTPKGGETITQEYTHLTIYCDEFIDFLEVAKPQDMISFLTACYNGKYGGVSTKGAGQDVVQNPFINILACMTRDTKTELTRQKIITSGFSRRCLFVYSNELGQAHPIIVVTPEMRKAGDECVAWLKKLQDVSGQFEWTEEGMAVYVDWYHKNHQSILVRETDAEKFFSNTKPVLLLKLSMLLQLAESTDLILTAANICKAAELLDEIEGNVKKLFASSGKNEQSELAEKIVEYVQNLKGKPIAIKKLHGIFWKDAKGGTKELDEVFAHLITSGVLHETKQMVGEGAQQKAIPFVSAKKPAEG